MNRIVPAAKRQRAEFVRSAIRKAIRETEEERTRRAYLEQPDSGAEADDWSSAEEWKARSSVTPEAIRMVVSVTPGAGWPSPQWKLRLVFDT